MKCQSFLVYRRSHRHVSQSGFFSGMLVDIGGKICKGTFSPHLSILRVVLKITIVSLFFVSRWRFVIFRFLSGSKCQFAQS